MFGQRRCRACHPNGWCEGVPQGSRSWHNPTEDDMNTRSIATLALAIAVLLLLFLVILPRL